MRPTETLAAYVAGARYEDFPAEVVLKAKHCILDLVGCGLGGAQMDIGRRQIEVAGLLGGTPESTVIGHGMKVSAPIAAYTNAQVANVLDFDDAVIPVPGHPSIAIVPPALAMGERAGASGREIITAVILGYEVGLRVAHACRSPIMPAGAGHPSLLMYSAYSVIGAAAAAGRILGLDSDKLIDAFGIAGGVAPGTARPTWVTPGTGSPEMGPVKANYGIYAFLGTLAALQADKGLYAHRDILDRDEFWTKTGANGCEYIELTRGLGSEYLILEAGFKPVPSCRRTHPQLSAVMKIREEGPISPADIDEIVLTGGPILPVYEWETMLDAEWSTPCAVALYLAGVEPGPAWYFNDRFKDSDIRELAAKIRFIEEPRYWEEWVRYGKFPARAEIKMKDGTVRRASVEYPKGERQNPFTEEEHRRKFAANARGILGEERSNRLYELLMDLESAAPSDVASLLSP